MRGDSDRCLWRRIFRRLWWCRRGRGDGETGYRLDTTKPTKDEDVQWFESLYAFLRVNEVAAAKGCVAVRNGHGQPWQVEEVGEHAILYVGDEDGSEEGD